MLRRISKHVKDQNWFAVAIDFFIVVFGIFMGFQVQAWNENRNNRDLERQYLDRLHGEITDMIRFNQPHVEFDKQSLASLEDIARYFVGHTDGAGGQEDITFSSDHCVALIQSHIYITRIVAPATLEELLSTGHILLISDSGIKSNIIKFIQSVVGMEQLRADVQSDRIALWNRYPDLIVAGLNWADAECRFEDMKARPDFVNIFIDNISRRRAFVSLGVIALQDQRIEFHEALDSELGISHDTPPKL